MGWYMIEFTTLGKVASGNQIPSFILWKWGNPIEMPWNAKVGGPANATFDDTERYQWQIDVERVPWYNLDAYYLNLS